VLSSAFHHAHLAEAPSNSRTKLIGFRGRFARGLISCWSSVQKGRVGRMSLAPDRARETARMLLTLRSDRQFARIVFDLKPLFGRAFAMGVNCRDVMGAALQGRVFFPPLAKGGLGGVVSAKSTTRISAFRLPNGSPALIARWRTTGKPVHNVPGMRPHPPWPPPHKGGKGNASVSPFSDRAHRRRAFRTGPFSSVTTNLSRPQR
jgi:hypothetical protein